MILHISSLIVDDTYTNHHKIIRHSNLNVSLIYSRGLEISELREEDMSSMV
jgi:hypothetical protein